ncbi:MAG: tripartite tricarboxylate transporter substrate binding protein [Burkholderiales bacterium]|nr:tripartite tricarboxylate transporter substrate binding protein [Burkholderiales bacterium]
MNKRTFLAACGAVLCARAGVASTWPQRPIRLIVPFPAGGAADLQARILASNLPAILGQPVVVENRSGAGGNVGAVGVANAPGDGYTLLMGTPGPMAINKHIYRDMQYDPESDFAPVSFVSRVANVLVINSKLAQRSAADFIGYLRSSPTPVAVAIPGKGSAAHLAVLALEDMAKVKLNKVLYKGSAPAIQDLIGGVVPFMISEMPSVMPHVKNGGLRALAVTTPERWPLTPELPLLSDVVPGFESVGWFVIVAPKSTPDAIVLQIRKAIDDTLAKPDVIGKLNSLGATPMGGSPEKQIRTESAKWKQVVAAAQLNVE